MTRAPMTPTPVHQVSKSHSPLTNGTWVLVADGEKALLLENIGDAERPILEVRREDHGEGQRTGELGTDRPGRRSDGTGAARSAVAESDWHRLEQHRFAETLAEMLYRRVHRHRIKRLILVAGPRVLGDLRKSLHAEVTACLVGEAALTLTHHPIDDIARHVAQAVTPELGPPED